jgi:hypothetical protein
MLSRRNFLNTALGAGAALATQGPQRAAAQVDRRLIVDAQVHLWKAESEGWKWVPGIVPQLPEPFTIERLVPMMDEAGVDRVVIVPPSWPGDRNDYALEAVRRYPTRFRIMGKLPLQDPKSAALLPKWREQPGMVGLRVIFNTPQTLPWLTDGTVDWFWAAAEKAELPVMCFAPSRTAAFGRIAERHPQLQLILDHMGTAAAMSVSRRGGAHQTRVRRLRPAAQLLGHRPDQYLRQGKLPPAHQPFHRRAELPLRERQGLGDGPRHHAAPEVHMSGPRIGERFARHRGARGASSVGAALVAALPLRAPTRGAPTDSAG